VEHGAFQVQGVVNGYGERTGNADLIPIAANLVLKMGAECLPDGSLERLTEVAHYVAEVANVAPDSRQPYAGRYAFTHKAGLHASGIDACHVRTSTWSPRPWATAAGSWRAISGGPRRSG
jgi:Isopropylmalate/homocitrate/citramalate synthases